VTNTYPLRLISRISLLMLPFAVWPSSGAVAQTDGLSAVLEEIVVTARRREESVQDVPISVLAFTADDLEIRGVDNIERLNVLVPNVSINGGGISGVTGSEILMRGIPGVTIYQDGIVQSGGAGILRNVVELERVEILRGPQGTLFGKNSSGGAIQFITTRPAEEFGARFKVTAGDYSRFDVTANVDVPMGDTLLTKFTVASLTRDGHVESQTIDRDFGEVDNQIFRADFLWQPNDAIRARFIADYNTVDSNGQARVIDNIGAPDCTVPFPPGNNGCIYQGFGFDYSQSQAYPGEWKTNSDYDGKGWVQDTYSYTADIEWDISDTLMLKSITGWREYDNMTYTDIDSTALNVFELYNFQENEQVSQEFQLQGSGDRLLWTAGVYYLDTDVRTRQQRWINADLCPACPPNQPGPAGSTGAQTLRDSWAVFAEGTYALTDQMNLTLGLRYTEETVNSFAIAYDQSTNPAFGTILYNTVGPLGFGGEETFDAFTPRVALQYRWNEDVMTYVSYSEGFTAGGLNTRFDMALPNNGLIPFDEETLENLEFGLRSDLFDGRLRFNATVFTSVYSDIQINEEVVPTRFTRTNAGEAEAKGLEIEGILAVSDSFRVNFALGWLDTKYTELGPTVQDVTLDSPFSYAPESAYSFGLQYDTGLANGASLLARLDYGWQDDFETARGTVNQIVKQEDYGLLSARVTYAPAGGSWDIALFGTNLTDEYYQTSGFFVPPLDARQFTLGRPREYGVTVRFNFD